MGDISEMRFQRDDPLDADVPGDWTDPPEGITCKYCGKAGFVWWHFEEAWRLCNDDGLHTCPEYVATKRKDLNELIIVPAS